MIPGNSSSAASASGSHSAEARLSPSRADIRSLSTVRQLRGGDATYGQIVGAGTWRNLLTVQWFVPFFPPRGEGELREPRTSRIFVWHSRSRLCLLSMWHSRPRLMVVGLLHPSPSVEARVRGSYEPLTCRVFMWHSRPGCDRLLVEFVSPSRGNRLVYPVLNEKFPRETNASIRLQCPPVLLSPPPLTPCRRD